MKLRKLQQCTSGTAPVIFAGICWGIISFFIRRLNQVSFSSLQIVAIRSWVSAILLFIGIIFKNPSLLCIHPRDIWMFAGTGIISTAFFTYCYFSSITRSGAAVAVVLLYTSPVFVILMSALFFHERITKRKLCAIVLTFLGCVLVAGLAGSGISLTPGALLLGLGSGFGYALYSIFARIAVKKYSPLTITFYTTLFCGVAMLFLINIRGTVFLIGQNLQSVWFSCICIALVCTVTPYICYTTGLRSMDAGKAAVLVTVEPLVGSIVGIMFFHETISLLKILGIVLIFIAVIIAGLPEKSQPA